MGYVLECFAQEFVAEEGQVEQEGVARDVAMPEPGEGGSGVGGE